MSTTFDLEISLDAIPFHLVARAAHECTRSYCELIGEHTERWGRVPEIIQASVIEGVRQHFIAATQGRMITPRQSHEAWLAYETAEGWKLGPTKNVELKLHPNLLPFEDLPKTQQLKDYLFCAIVGVFVEVLLLPEILRETHRETRMALLESLRPEVEPIAPAARPVGPFAADTPPWDETEPVTLGAFKFEHLPLGGREEPNENPRLIKEQGEVLLTTEVLDEELAKHAEVDDSRSQLARGDDAADHGLSVPPVRETQSDPAVERVRGIDGPDGESEPG